MADDLIGKRIGGYEVLGLIGRGGMATVYRAYQLSMNRVVALKILPRHFLNHETFLQRFHREVRIIATLEHRGIVPVHDYGETEDGQPYIVMRYIAGGSVDDLLDSGPLPTERIRAILDQIAPALDYAHSKNVLHRDLKPSNILIDEEGGAYLTDFGIARMIGEGGGTITTQGVVGTPSYMSPEQAQGQPLDNRSDIYALGVTLFEMATGRRPFESDTPYGVAVLHVTTPPPQPRALNAEVPPAVEQVILTALSKTREGRYPNAAALAEAFKRAAEAPIQTVADTQPRPIYAPPTVPTPKEQPRVPTPPPVPPRRRPNLLLSAVAGGLIGCALLALIAVIALLVVQQTAREEDAARATMTAQAQPTPDLTTSAEVEIDRTSVRIVVPAEARTVEATEQPSDPPATVTPPASTVDLGDGLRGSLVYFAERDGDFGIFRFDLASRDEAALTPVASVEAYPAVSPDGTQIAFISDRDGDYDLYVMPAGGGNARRLTSNRVTDRTPAWSPDGEWLVYSSDTRGDGSHDLYRVRVEGGEPELLYSDGQRNIEPRYSSDAERIVFTAGAVSDAATWEIRLLNLESGEAESLTDNGVKDWSPAFAPDGGILYSTEGEGRAALALIDTEGGAARILYDGAGYEWAARFSPDGQIISFTSDMTGRDEIYVMTAAGTDARQMTRAGALYADWIAP